LPIDGWLVYGHKTLHQLDLLLKKKIRSDKCHCIINHNTLLHLGLFIFLKTFKVISTKQRFKIVNNIAPLYLSELLKVCQPKRKCPSLSGILLQTKKYKIEM